MGPPDDDPVYGVKEESRVSVVGQGGGSSNQEEFDIAMSVLFRQRLDSGHRSLAAGGWPAFAVHGLGFPHSNNEGIQQD
jgi:hypothetical protein